MAIDVVLLRDDPSDADEFGAQSHNKVAKAIANLIESEQGGKVIGLEGKWGSGKSTVVQLLGQHLDAGKTRMLIFDAWAHQGDPLRRTFLESVIDILEEASWLDQERAKSIRDKLMGRSSQLHTSSSPRLSPEGIFVSLSALLIPLGIALFSNNFGSYHLWALLVGGLFLIAPLIVVFGFFVLKCIRIATGGKRANAGWRRAWAALPSFRYFSNEQETTSETKGIELGEPTSVEFERLFSEALSQSLEGSRRLLVVLDNLDRVEESNAKTLLATMQTFTTASVHSRKSWASNVWTLIPYDPDGLDRLWSFVAPEPGYSGSNGQNERLMTSSSASFIEKIFAVRFEAPPLVLSDWRDYLNQLLRKAMPSVNLDELLAANRLRALYPTAEPGRPVSKEAPTPRQLKQFVNQIGAILRQRDDIPFVHVAYYTLLRHDRIDVATELINDRLPHPKLSHVLLEKVGEDLAALLFGTEHSIAQQLLLGGVLRDALVQGNSEKIAQLKELPGFIEVLDSLDTKIWMTDGGVELTTYIGVLDAAEVFNIPGGAKWLKTALLPLARINPEWSVSGRKSGIGLALLLDNLSPDDATLADLLTKVAVTSREADTGGLLHLEGIAGLADCLSERKRYTSSLRIVVKITADQLISSIAHYGRQITREESQVLLEFANTPVDVAEALVLAATTNNFQEAHEALDLLLKRQERFDIRVFGDGCVNWLRDNETSSASQLDTLLDCIDRARHELVAKDFLLTATDDGTLMKVVGFAYSNNWHVQAASAAMLHLSTRSDLPAYAEGSAASLGALQMREILRDPSINPEIMAAQFAWLEKHDNEAFGLLVDISADSTFQPWVNYQLIKLAETAKLVVSANQYLKDWQHLRRALSGDGFNEITRVLFAHASDRATIIAGSSAPELAMTATQAISPDAGEAIEIRTWANAIVMGASGQDWQSALASPIGGPLLDLAIMVAENADAPADLPGLSNALHSHFQLLAAGDAAWQPNSDVFARLTKLLGAAARKVTASELCAALEGRGGVVGSGLIPTYGTFLAGEAAFRTHTKLPNFIERAIALDQWSSVEWIVSVAQVHHDILQVMGRSAEMENLTNRVREKLSEYTRDGSEPPVALSALSALLES